MDIRVSHLSLEVQGIYDREPTIHLSRIDWQREKTVKELLKVTKNVLLKSAMKSGHDNVN